MADPNVAELLGILDDTLTHLPTPDNTACTALWIARATLRELADVLGSPEALAQAHQGDWVCPLA